MEHYKPTDKRSVYDDLKEAEQQEKEYLQEQAVYTQQNDNNLVIIDDYGYRQSINDYLQVAIY